MISTFAMPTLALVFAATLAVPNPPQDPPKSIREAVNAVGTVERIDRSSRALTLRVDANIAHTIYVGPEITLFDELRNGDRVSVRLYDSVVVAVRPGAKPSVPVDSTKGAKGGDPSGKTEVMQQVKASVMLESIDPKTNVIVYKTGDNRRIIRTVADPRLLDGLKPGDVVEITYSRERALELHRAR